MNRNTNIKHNLKYGDTFKMIEFEANNSHYNIISILGQCCDGVGVVYLAKHTPTGQMVAIKKFNMDKVKDEVNLIEVRGMYFKNIP